MKTAEEWTWGEWATVCLKDQIRHIEEIQLDAWKQGMSDAAKLVDNNFAGDIQTWHEEQTTEATKQAILATKDKRTEI